MKHIDSGDRYALHTLGAAFEPLAHGLHTYPGNLNKPFLSNIRDTVARRRIP